MAKRIRKPVNEIMNKSNQGKGLKCPKCGAIQFQTYATRPTIGGIYRYKKCRACGQNIRTKES